MAMATSLFETEMVEHVLAQRPMGYSLMAWLVMITAAAILLERILAIGKIVGSLLWYPLWLVYVFIKWMMGGTTKLKLKTLAKNYTSGLSSHQQVLLHGKHRGWTFEECLEQDPDYVVWVMDHCNTSSSTSLLKLKVWAQSVTTREDLKARVVRQTYKEAQSSPPARQNRDTTTTTTATTVTRRTPSALSSQHLLRRWRLLVIDMIDENEREEKSSARRLGERWREKRLRQRSRRQ
jgi:hypothetical protein